MKRILSKGLCLVLALMLCVTLSCPAFAAGEEKTTVRFGLLPYTDWMPWMMADELGMFDEVGIDLEVTVFADDITCAEALAAGDIDIACGNSGSGPLVFSRFPNVRAVSCTCGFVGFAIMVRPESLVSNGGDIKLYTDFYDEYIAAGMSEEEAKVQATADACAQLKGRTMVMDRGTGSVLPLNAALKAANLKPEDINYMDISDVEGALAFLEGTGDFELGGFPQVNSLSEKGCSKLVSAVELGGQAVCLSVEMATTDYIENNMDTLAKMRQVWFKAIDGIYGEDSTYIEKLAEVTSAYTGSTYTVEDMLNVANNIDPWPNMEQTPAYFFESGAPWDFVEIYGGSLNSWINTQKQVDEGAVDLTVQLDTLKQVHEAAVQLG